MTTEMNFNSHVRRIIGATVALVNALSPGEDGGRAVAEPAGAPLCDAVRVALTAAGCLFAAAVLIAICWLGFQGLSWFL